MDFLLLVTLRLIWELVRNFDCNQSFPLANKSLVEANFGCMSCITDNSVWRLKPWFPLWSLIWRGSLGSVILLFFSTERLLKPILVITLLNLGVTFINPISDWITFENWDSYSNFGRPNIWAGSILSIWRSSVCKIDVSFIK